MRKTMTAISALVIAVLTMFSMLPLQSAYANNGDIYG